MNILSYKLFYILFFFFISFNIFAKENINHSENIENRINSIVERYGYQFSLLEDSKNGEWDAIKVRLNLIEYKKSRIIPPIKHIVIDKNNTFYYMVFDIYKGKNDYSNFKNVKHALSNFQRKEYSRLMVFSMPVQGSLKTTMLLTTHYMSTNYSILINNKSQAILGMLFERNEEVFKNITQQVVRAKKQREESVIKSIYEKRPELFLNSGDVNLKKVIAVLFSETCGYCKKMIREVELYNNKGYTLLPLPATTLYFDEKFNQSTHKYFCGNIQNNFKTLTPENKCYSEEIEDIFDFKKHLLGGVEYKGTPTLYLTEYGLWFSGYMSPDRLW